MNIDTAKAIITERPNFNPTSAFRQMTSSNYIHPLEVKEFCESYGIVCNEREATAIVDNWDQNGDRLVGVHEFKEAILSKRVVPLKKVVGARGGELRPEEVRYQIAKVLEAELWYFRDTEPPKAKLAGLAAYETRAVFDHLIKGEGEISKSHIQRILYLSNQQIELLLQRLDVNNDGKISLEDFKESTRPLGTIVDTPEDSWVSQPVKKTEPLNTSQTFAPVARAQKEVYSTPIKSTNPNDVFKEGLQQRLRDRIIKHTPIPRKHVKSSSVDFALNKSLDLIPGTRVKSSSVDFGLIKSFDLKHLTPRSMKAAINEKSTQAPDQEPIFYRTMMQVPESVGRAMNSRILPSAERTARQAPERTSSVDRLRSRIAPSVEYTPERGAPSVERSASSRIVSVEQTIRQIPTRTSSVDRVMRPLITLGVETTPPPRRTPSMGGTPMSGRAPIMEGTPMSRVASSVERTLMPRRAPSVELTPSPVREPLVMKSTSPGKATATVSSEASRQMNSDAQLEKLKGDMLDEYGFSLKSAFQLFDIGNDGFITQKDLEQGLDKLNVIHSNESTGRLIFDKSGSGRWSYSDFCSILLPTTEQNSPAVRLNGPEKLPMGAINALRRVFQALMAQVNAAENFKASLAKSENLKGIFGTIVQNKLGMRSPKETVAQKVMRNLFKGYVETPVKSRVGNQSITWSPGSARLSP